MSPWKVVVTDQVFPDVDRERRLLEAIDARLQVAEGDRETVLEQAADAHALLNTYFPIDAEAISRLSRCKIIARYGIGVDNIDLDAAAKAGISVTNVPDYCVDEVAAHTVAMLLSLLRKLPTADRATRAGSWGVGTVRPVRRLADVTVGLVGYGRIGRRVTQLLEPFGCSILVHDPYLQAAPGVELVALDDLLRRSDAVSLHSPLTDETRGLIGPEQLGLMAGHAVLINTSRGPLVQLDPLVEALRTEHLAGAALDVFEHEPPDASRFADVENLLVSPHIAFYSEDAIAESQTKAATQVVKALQGQPLDYRLN